MYFIKEQIPAVGAINIPDSLIPPCDLDDVALSAADCAAYTGGQALTYYTCPSMTSTYADSLALVSDARCEDEDRLLQCEMEGREVDSNINNVNRKELFDFAFIKTGHQIKVRQREKDFFAKKWGKCSIKNFKAREKNVTLDGVSFDSRRFQSQPTYYRMYYFFTSRIRDASKLSNRSNPI